MVGGPALHGRGGLAGRMENPMKNVRKIISIDEELCDGCGQCVMGCAESALRIVDGKARLTADRYCDGLGACLGECPTGALKIIEREADAFDEEAVEALAATQREAPAAAPGQCAGLSVSQTGPAHGAGLSHWPVRLRLVPPNAPFLRNARLLLTADCVPVAMPAYHSDWLPGRVVLLGCPKFDEVRPHVDKLRDIFAQNDIAHATVLEMEVPCCSGMRRIAEAARAASGRKVPIERVVVSRRGEVVEKEMVGAKRFSNGQIDTFPPCV